MSATPGVSASVRSATSSAVASARGQPQRAAHAGVLGDRDGVPGERQVDQVTGAVAGQPAHPQQLQVPAQLAFADPEVGGRLGDRDARTGDQVRAPATAAAATARSRRSRSPRAPVGTAWCTGRACAAAAAAQFARTAAASSSGCSTDHVRPVPGQPPGHRLQAAQIQLQLVAGSAVEGPRAQPRPSRRSPCGASGRHPHPRDTGDRGRLDVVPRPWPSGRRRPARVTAPVRPVGVTGSRIRDTRNERGASRSRSCPTRYQRPRQDTTPHGSTVRRVSLPGRAAAAVVEADHPPGLHRGQQRRERRLGGADPGLDPAAVVVHLDPGGAQLDQRPVRRVGQLRGLPQPGGQGDRGRLVRLQVDLAELVVAAARCGSRRRCRSRSCARSPAGRPARAARSCPARTSGRTRRRRARRRSRARWPGSARRTGTGGWTAGRAPGSPDARPARRTRRHRTARPADDRGQSGGSRRRYIFRPADYSSYPLLRVVPRGRRRHVRGEPRGRDVDGGGRLRISLLGELAASSGAEPLDLGGPRQRAVLGRAASWPAARSSRSTG